MDKSVFKAGFFHSEGKAHKMLEGIRWPDGPICPHCGANKIYRLKVTGTKRCVLKCGTCRKQFAVTVGTIFEDSHLPLTCWLAAIHLMCASKKGMSALQLQRMLGIKTYKSAWFMAYRIRYAMTELSSIGKLTGIVEVDETYVGGKKQGKALGLYHDKTPVVSLVERKGRVRSFVVDRVTGGNLKTIIRKNVYEDTRIMTDQFTSYRGLNKHFASHETVDHSKHEWVRGEAHVNTAEGFFSLLKRGIVGTFHYVGSQHLHRYLAEFDFRYNARAVEDGLRAALAVRGIEGKRLQYK